MSHQIIVYETENKNIAVMRVELNCGLTVEQIAAKDVPAGKAFTIIDIDLVPIDREHRAAWELKEGKIVVNQTKADAIDAEIVAKASTRQAVLDKLGLTQDEAQALLG